MGLLDENFEPEIEFGVFFDIVDVTIKHRQVFGSDGLDHSIEYRIKEALGSVGLEPDFKGRIRPVKEDIIRIVYDNIRDKNIVSFMQKKNRPQVSFSSCTADLSYHWGEHEPKYVPKLHIVVQVPTPMLEDKTHFTTNNFKDILTISLINKQLLNDPEWLAEIENKTKNLGSPLNKW